RSRGCGEPEGRLGEAEPPMLDRLDCGVEHEVPPRDSGVDRSRADVHRDIAGAQVEELDLVLRVDEDQLAAVPALSVPRLTEEIGGRARQGALIRYCDTQHDSSTGACRRRRGSGPWPA